MLNNLPTTLALDPPLLPIGYIGAGPCVEAGRIAGRTAGAPSALVAKSERIGPLENFILDGCF